MIQIPNPGQYDGDERFYQIISRYAWFGLTRGGDPRTYQPVTHRQVYRVPPQVDLLGKWSGDFDHRGAFLDSAPKTSRYELKQIHRAGHCLVCGERANPYWRLDEEKLVSPAVEDPFWTPHGCVDAWGHKECLEKIQNGTVSPDPFRRFPP